MIWPCEFSIYCPITLSGAVNGTYKGTFCGTIDAAFKGQTISQFQGVIIGVFHGTAIGDYCGTLVGDFHGTIGGVQFDGDIDQEICTSINGTLNGSIHGDFGGKLDGTITGHFTGQLCGYINAFIHDGSLTGPFGGTIDNIPTDVDYPFPNVTREPPDVPGGFDLPDFVFDFPNTGFNPGPYDPGTVPPGGNLIQYSNNEQSYTITCSDLSEYTATVPANTVALALTQSVADGAALALAQELAEYYCVHSFVPPLVGNTIQICGTPCASGGFSSFTVLANTVFGMTNVAADANAYAYACQRALLACSPLAPPPAPLPPGGTGPGGGLPPIPPPTLPPGLPPGVAYTNSDQTATIDCPNGGTFAYTCKAGRWFANTIPAANAMALSYALDQAMTLRFCFFIQDNRGNQGYHAISDFRIAINEDYDGAIVELARTGVNTLFDNPYSFVLSGAPPWLPSAFISPPGVVILGSPPDWTFQYGSAIERAVATTAGQYATIFTITQDSPGYRIVATRTMPWYVGQIATDSQLPDASVGGSYNEQLLTEFMLAPFDWRLADGSDPLPDGLTLNANGTITGMPTAEDTVTIDVEVTDAAYVTTHKQFDISVVANCISNTSPLSSGVVGTPYSVQLLAPGLTAPLNWTNTGALPGGLTLNQETGFITGTPTTAAATSFQANVIDDVNVGCNKVFSITISATAPADCSGFWSDFPWVVDFADGDPSGSATVDPEGDLEGVPSINFVVLQPGPDPAWGQGVQSEVSGTKSYTGPSRLVHIKVFVNSNPGLNAPIEVFILSSQQGLILDENVQDPGTHDWDILIREGVAEDWFIFFNVVTDSTSAQAALDYTITLSESGITRENLTGIEIGLEDATHLYMHGDSISLTQTFKVTLNSPTLFNWAIGMQFTKNDFGTTYFNVAPTILYNGAPLALELIVSSPDLSFWQIVGSDIAERIFRDTNNCVPATIEVSAVSLTPPAFQFTTGFENITP